MPVRSNRAVDVTTLDEYVRILCERRAATALCDVEPAVVHWLHSQAAYADGLRAVVRLIAAEAPTVTEVVFASNGDRPRPGDLEDLPLPVRVFTRAGKPWRTAPLRELRHPVVVLGDQPLTDGLLAWRLGAGFVRWVGAEAVPWWPRWQSRLGAPLLRILTWP